MTESFASEYDSLIETAASLTSADIRREIYEEIQLKAQEEAVGIWMYQTVARMHFQEWMDVPFYNPAYAAPAFSYVYAMDKIEP